MITVHEEIADKKRFMELLLIGDEQESRILMKETERLK